MAGAAGGVEGAEPVVVPPLLAPVDGAGVFAAVDEAGGVDELFEAVVLCEPVWLMP